MQWLTSYVLPIAAWVASAVIFFFIGVFYRKKVAEKEIKSAEDEARRILNEAIKNAEAKKREALIEAKEEILKIKTNRNASLRSAGTSFRNRSAGCSKRTRFWTRSSTILRQKRKP